MTNSPPNATSNPSARRQVNRSPSRITERMYVKAGFSATIRPAVPAATCVCPQPTKALGSTEPVSPNSGSRQPSARTIRQA